MNAVDSCGWLEFFADGPNAEFFAPLLLKPEELLVPSVTVYEVFRRLAQQRGEELALLAVAAMMRGEVVPLDGGLAVSAARIAASERLALADAAILATVRSRSAILWTQDADFEHVAGVRYRPRSG